MKVYLVFLMSFLHIASCKKDENLKRAFTDQENNIFLVPFQVGNKWGLSDTLGNIKVKPEYDEPIDFDVTSVNTEPISSYYIMRKGKELIFIDSKNKRYFEDFQVVQDSNKKICFKKNNKMGFSRPNFIAGKWEIDEDPKYYQYDSIINLKDQLHFYNIVEKGKKKGLLEGESKIVIPVLYDSISYTINNGKAVFKGYQGTANADLFTFDLTLPPPPSNSHENRYTDWLERDPQEVEQRSVFKNYKNVYRFKNHLIPIIIKDNNTNRYAIYGGDPEKPLEFKYDFIQPCLAGSAGREPEKLLIVKTGNKYGLCSQGGQRESQLIYDYIIQKTFYNKYNNLVHFIVAKKGTECGMLFFDWKKKNFTESIPFNYDDIIEGDIVIKNNLYGRINNVSRPKVKIPPIYLKKPKEYKNIAYNGNQYRVYESINKKGKKVLILSNGVELYREK